MLEFLAEMGDEARERPEPTLRGSIVAAAAVLAVGGLFVLAVDAGDGGTNTVGIVLGLIAVGAGHAVLVSLSSTVRPAGIATIALGTFMAVAFVFDDLDSPGLALFLVTVAYGAQWVVGPARGASTLLTLALLGAWAFLLDAVAGDPTGSETVVSLTDDLDVPGTASLTGGDDTVSYLSLLVGIALLAGVRALDVRRFRGTATSLVIVGDIAFVTGVFGVASTFDADAAGSLFVLVGGLVLAFVGAGGGRRFTTWLGGVGILIGLLALLSTAVDLESATEFGLVAIIFGVGIVVAAAFVPATKAAPVGAGSDPGGQPVSPPAEPAAVAAPEPEPDADPAPTTELLTGPPAADPTPQGWHPDPTGRHELRWHNGTEWTPNVADRGQTSTDEGV